MSHLELDEIRFPQIAAEPYFVLSSVRVATFSADPRREAAPFNRFCETLKAR